MVYSYFAIQLTILNQTSMKDVTRMVKRAYLELVLNEFYAYYGDQIEGGELFTASLEHPYLVIGHDIYLVLRTGVLKLSFTQNKYKVQTQLGRVETLWPTQILSLAETPFLVQKKPKAALQLEQFANRIDSRLSEVTIEGLNLLSRRLDGIYNEYESVEEIESYVAYFWHGEFIQSSTSLISDEE